MMDSSYDSVETSDRSYSKLVATGGTRNLSGFVGGPSDVHSDGKFDVTGGTSTYSVGTGGISRG